MPFLEGGFVFEILPNGFLCLMKCQKYQWAFWKIIKLSLEDILD